jgi:hypothetical protein
MASSTKNHFLAVNNGTKMGINLPSYSTWRSHAPFKDDKHDELPKNHNGDLPVRYVK